LRTLGRGLGLGCDGGPKVKLCYKPPSPEDVQHPFALVGSSNAKLIVQLRNSALHCYSGFREI
jgi:hypothetical protein